MEKTLPENVDFASFSDRPLRAQYMARLFGGFLKGSVLDVGCDRRQLNSLINADRYTGIDFAGAPDLTINLEQTASLPFADGEFDCVVCTDVLEHLNNLHHIFGELIRVSRGTLVISLPNNWVNARQPIERGRGSFNKYGLPVEPPADRHKWFFSLSEARDFLKAAEDRYPVRVVEMRATEKPRPLPLRLLLHLRSPRQECYLNRYAHTLWAVLQKTS